MLRDGPNLKVLTQRPRTRLAELRLPIDRIEARSQFWSVTWNSKARAVASLNELTQRHQLGQLDRLSIPWTSCESIGSQSVGHKRVLRGIAHPAIDEVTGPVSLKAWPELAEEVVGL